LNSPEFPLKWNEEELKKCKIYKLYIYKEINIEQCAKETAIKNNT